MACVRTNSTSPGPSKRCCARDCSFQRKTWAIALSVPPSSSSARRACSSCSTSRRARCSWATGQAGWVRGRDWLSAQAMIGRGNFAAALVGGKLTRAGAPTDPLALARKHGRGNDLDDLMAFFGELLHGTPPNKEWSARLVKVLGGG